MLTSLKDSENTDLTKIAYTCTSLAHGPSQIVMVSMNLQGLRLQLPSAAVSNVTISSQSAFHIAAIPLDTSVPMCGIILLEFLIANFDLNDERFILQLLIVSDEKLRYLARY
jgi:hypothetical protein